MEAKDTVMSDDQIIEFMAKLTDNPSLLVKMIEVISKVQYQAGIKEVGEWLSHQYLGGTVIMFNAIETLKRGEMPEGG